jgi:hypothetical protein
VEGFLKLMQKQIHSGGKRGFFSKRSVGPQVREKLTIEDMLCFQKVIKYQFFNKLLIFLLTA